MYHRDTLKLRDFLDMSDSAGTEKLFHWAWNRGEEGLQSRSWNNFFLSILSSAKRSKLNQLESSFCQMQIIKNGQFSELNGTLAMHILFLKWSTSQIMWTVTTSLCRLGSIFRVESCFRALTLPAKLLYTIVTRQK